MHNENEVSIAFNIIEIPATDGRLYARTGVCTGWLQNVITHNNNAKVNKTGGAFDRTIDL